MWILAVDPHEQAGGLPANLEHRKADERQLVSGQDYRI
jgi:hypothetical protein